MNPEEDAIIIRDHAKLRIGVMNLRCVGGLVERRQVLGLLMLTELDMEPKKYDGLRLRQM